MKDIRSIMGMPVTLQVTDPGDHQELFEYVFAFLTEVDEQFSTYKETSEVSQINAGKIQLKDASPLLHEILVIAEKTKRETKGFFDVMKDDILDPSGIVKGWAIAESARMFAEAGLKNYYVEIAGDIQVAGHNSQGKPWSIGIRNPFKWNEVVKVLEVNNHGVATSGTAARGQHIYNPHRSAQILEDIVSLTVIAPSILDADRFATAAFAMQEDGIAFIAKRPELAGYAIDKKGIATFTPNFEAFVVEPS